MPPLILIASGSEIGLIVAAAERLQKEGLGVRCVSMSSWDLFDALSQADRNSVLPAPAHARLAVETGAPSAGVVTWAMAGDVIDVDRFGVLALDGVVMNEYGFSIDNVCRRAKALLD